MNGGLSSNLSHQGADGVGDAQGQAAFVSPQAQKSAEAAAAHRESQEEVGDESDSQSSSKRSSFLKVKTAPSKKKA